MRTYWTPEEARAMGKKGGLSPKFKGHTRKPGYRAGYQAGFAAGRKALSAASSAIDSALNAGYAAGRKSSGWSPVSESATVFDSKMRAANDE